MQIERLGDLTARLDAEAKAADYVRWLGALAMSRGDVMAAASVFSKNWPTAKNIGVIRKAATIAVGTLIAAPIVELAPLAAAFLDAARPYSILGRLVGYRQAPANIKVPVQTAAASVAWAGEGRPTTVTAPSFSSITLPAFLISGIVVMTQELVRLSNPSAEALVRAELAAAVAALEDRALLDPAAAAVSDVSPASITNGLTPIASTGAAAAAIAADLGSLLAAIGDAVNPVFILRPTTATSIARIGGAAFPNLGPRGGAIWGVPVLTSASAPANCIVALDATGLIVADDGLEIDFTKQASLQMDSAPTNPPTASTVLVSLWQTNLVGFKATRFLNWAVRPGSVAMLSGANY